MEDIVDETLKNHLRLCKSFEPPSIEELERKSIEVGPKLFGKTIIFDLDETLFTTKTSFIPKEIYEVIESKPSDTSLGSLAESQGQP